MSNVSSDSSLLPPDEFRPEEYSIILIDDDPDSLALFQELLRSEGFRVYGRSSPEEGLRLMKQIYFDLLICDLRMPKLDGIQVITELRKLKPVNEDSSLPIILLTAADTDWGDLAREAGANALCQKRNAVRDLSRHIRELLLHS